MAAAFYIVFGRIVFHVVPPQDRTWKLLWTSPRFLTPIFVCCDLLAFFMQGAGASLLIPNSSASLATQKSNFDKGKAIVLLGLGVQIACFGLFSVIAVRFHFTSRRYTKTGNFDRRIGGSPTDKYVMIEGKRLLRNWETLLWVVNVTCLMILVSP